MINSLKNILSDIGVLYRNIIHWNISKILCYVFALILGLLLGLPFLILLVIITYFDPINWQDIVVTYTTTQSFGLSLISAISNHYIILILEALLLVTAFGFFAFGYAYYIIPLSKLYFNYLEGEKIPYFSNIYFNLKSIKKYLYILGWGALILLIPFLIFLLLFVILLLSFGGIESVFQTYQTGGFSMFSVIVGIIFLLCLLLFIYLSYRISYAYLIFLDTKNYQENKSGMYYIKESFRITSGLKIFKFLLVMVLFTIFMIPVEFIAKIFENFGNIGSFVFTIISFLTISGLFEFIIFSTYRNIMIAGKNNDLNNKESIVIAE